MKIAKRQLKRIVKEAIAGKEAYSGHGDYFSDVVGGRYNRRGRIQSAGFNLPPPEIEAAFKMIDDRGGPAYFPKSEMDPSGGTRNAFSKLKTKDFETLHRYLASLTGKYDKGAPGADELLDAIAEIIDLRKQHPDIFEGKLKITKSKLKRIIKEEYTRLKRQGLLRETLEDISFISGDLLDLASRPEGVTLDEINDLFGPDGFEVVDDLSAQGIVWLDDQQGVVYASGSQPSSGLSGAIDKYMGY